MQTRTRHYDLHVTITESAGSTKVLLCAEPLELNKLLYQSCQSSSMQWNAFVGLLVNLCVLQCLVVITGILQKGWLQFCVAASKNREDAVLQGE